MAVIKQDETYNASYWKAFPKTKENKAELCLFKDDVEKVRGNALKRIIVEIDYSTMEYDAELSLADAVSKFTYEQCKVSNLDEEGNELNWFADSEDAL